jgi:hypothetical protein
VLQYTGWYSMYAPGYATHEAVKTGTLPEISAPRIATELASKWQALTERWKFVPPALRDAAFVYLRRKEETNDFHPQRFLKQGSSLELDPATWNDWRTQWQAELDAALDNWRSVDTTRTYATQVWPRALEQMKAMYNEVALLSWSWEYYIRGDAQQEDPEAVKASWPPEIAKQAVITPGRRKQAFDEASHEVEQGAGIPDFLSRYAKAVMAGTKPPGED